ncbi:MAG: hypothetical protein NVS3B15_12470 [Sediminibacterium sp.]
MEQLADDEGKVFFEIKVKDSGIGISEENQATIFEQYVQASADITRKFGGTGLGLSICRSLTQMQGGTISVKSALNDGSTFIVRMPYKISLQSEAKQTLQKSDPFKETEKLKILVAEDVAVNQLIAKHILGNHGHVVANGKEAIKMLEKESYDLVLMDIHMPEMDGLEATKLIRSHSNPTVAVIPVIALTAAAFKEEAASFLQAGMNDIITKPYTEEKLLEVIRKVMFPATANAPTDTTVAPMAENLQEKLYDLSELKALDPGDNSVLAEIVQVFLKNTPNDVEALAAVIRSEDTDATYKLAHKIKSSIFSMGIHSLSRVITAIESNAKQQENLNEIPFLFDKVQKTIAAVIVQLKTDFNL